MSIADSDQTPRACDQPPDLDESVIDLADFKKTVHPDLANAPLPGKRRNNARSPAKLERTIIAFGADRQLDAVASLRLAVRVFANDFARLIEERGPFDRSTEQCAAGLLAACKALAEHTLSKPSFDQDSWEWIYPADYASEQAAADFIERLRDKGYSPGDTVWLRDAPVICGHTDATARAIGQQRSKDRRQQNIDRIKSRLAARGYETFDQWVEAWSKENER